jgi:NAD+ diphosphatase
MEEFQSDPTNIPFAQSGFDRQSLYRDRARYFNHCLGDGSATVVLVHDRKVALSRRDSGFDATLVDASMIRRDHLDVLGGTFLGNFRGRPVFALSCDDHPRRLLTLESPPLQFFDLRQASALLEEDIASLLGYALAMDYWHRTHRYCGVCGNPTEASETGHLRTCLNRDCGRRHFPRTDPAIIVLVEDGRDSCLLGRKREWPDRRYSTIAGFVEPGETPEQAVLREVHEETGTSVRWITYKESQPWPFPGSLMLGYSAIAERGKIRLLDNELQDARWFTRDEIQLWVPDGRLRLPPRISIAYRLIENWFQRDDRPRLDSLDPGSCGHAKP